MQTPRPRVRGALVACASKPPTGRQVFGAFVPFASAEPGPDGWIPLAYAVEMKSGVALSKKDFEDCVDNFNRYPCVPIVIEHADTDPWAPAEWKAPHGHIDALRVGTMTRTMRDGSTREVAALEGKPSYDEATLAAVKARTWRFGSITIIQGAVDEETGAKLGSMLWSWSLTAHPRLTGLPAIAASRRGAGDVVQAGWWYGQIEDRDDLIACLREIFDLPVTSTEADVLAALDKLGALASGEGETDGVDVDHIVCQLRDALRLPALTTTSEVLAEVKKGLDTLPTDPPADAPASSMSRAATAAAHPTTEIPTMKTFLELAASSGLVATSEEDAKAKILALAALGADALKGLGLASTATPTELAQCVSKLTTAAAQVPALETELTTFRTAKAEADRVAREEHLAAIFLANPALKAAEASLRLHAERDWEGFTKAHPKPTTEQLAQSAQNAQRTAQVVPFSAGTPPAAEGAEKKSQATEIEALRTVYARHGFDLSLPQALDLLSRGETPETVERQLQRQG